MSTAALDASAMCEDASTWEEMGVCAPHNSCNNSINILHYKLLILAPFTRSTQNEVKKDYSRHQKQRSRDITNNSRAYRLLKAIQ